MGLTSDRQFEVLCASLRQNDGGITRVFMQSVTGYGPRLGNALLHNTTVTYLSLAVSSMLNANDGTTIQDVAPLFLYLQTSMSLKEVRLCSESLFGSLLESNLIHRVLECLAANASVTTVDIKDMTMVPPWSIGHLLNVSTSMKFFSFDDRSFQMDEPANRQVATALGSNRTVQDLTIFQTLRYFADNPPRMPEDPILSQLCGHPTLQSLCLYMIGPFEVFTLAQFELLARLLSSTPSLDCLELKFCMLNRPALRLILEALRTTKTLTKICFSDCKYDEESTLDFTHFMQTHLFTDELKEVSIKKSCSESFQNSTVATVAANMLIGSSLPCFHLCEGQPLDHDHEWPRDRDHPIDMVSFFNIWTENEPMIRLADLRLEYLGPDGANALLEFLPKATRLRNLVVSRLVRGIDSTAFVSTLRKNGSLYSVTIMQVDVAMDYDRHWSDPTSIKLFCVPQYSFDREPQPFFTDDELRLVEAYCKRNQMIPLLLQPPLSRPSHNGSTASVGSAAGAATAAAENSGGSGSGATTHLALVPDLFGATLPSVRMVPNSLLTGLLAASGDMLETRRHVMSTKRKLASLRF